MNEGSFLRGVRVIEVADELGEYCGKVLAGLGADVVKVEPPGGEVTRTYGPFVDDVPHADRSLYFWHYNFGKRSTIVDLDDPQGQARFRALVADADVLLDARPRGYLDERGVGSAALRALDTSLVVARVTPFGDSGPWRDLHASDLVHLALGGVMMNCGYDRNLRGEFDTPPIAPQMWQAYHLAGEHLAIAVVAALVHRLSTGEGQEVTTAVHQAVSVNTETDVPNWVYLRQSHLRQTCRHSMPVPSLPAIARTKDGRWLLPYRTYLPQLKNALQQTWALLDRFGLADGIEAPADVDPARRTADDVAARVGAAVDLMIGRSRFADDLWRDGQELGLPWAPLRRPEENLADDHWWHRGTFVDVAHPELDRDITYIGAKWFSPGLPWRSGPRASTLGEAVDRADPWPTGRRARPAPRAASTPDAADRFALSGVRVVDLSWLLASGGAGRFFTSLGAEVIKVEHQSRTDTMRWGQGIVPPGGRAQRDAATEAIPTPENSGDPNRGGSFMEINAGKHSLSLDLKHPRARAILVALIERADIVIEGFSPGTMDRLGFGYDALRAINPRIIYVQQSGMGQHGTYPNLRSYGPTAQAFSGLSEMSGLPEPFAPAGIGYSYLDWFGAYNMALAMMAALHRQRATGDGCWIDASQVDTGLYLTGTSVLDFVVNGRRTSRTGNRSPSKPAAPHGAYRTAGRDRWIAISCFDDASWQRAAEVLGLDAVSDPRFATLDARCAHADELDVVVEAATSAWDGDELMTVLQAAGVAAGVCQTAADRCDRDPQLAHLRWTVELPQTDIGVWPVKAVPFTMSATPPRAGGPLGRHGPSYGEDTEHVLSEVLGLGAEEIAQLRAEGAW